MLKVNQPAVSKLEQRADMYVSSLRSYIEAVGGRVQDRRRVSQRRGRYHQTSPTWERLGSPSRWGSVTFLVDGSASRRNCIGDNRAMAGNRFSLRSKPGLTVIWPTLAFCLMAALLTGAACTRQDQSVKWGYDGPGAPEHWASLSEEYATCADGQRQSPIDVSGYDRGDAAPISFSYSGDAAGRPQRRQICAR